MDACRPLGVCGLYLAVAIIAVWGGYRRAQPAASAPALQPRTAAAAGQLRHGDGGDVLFPHGRRCSWRCGVFAVMRSLRKDGWRSSSGLNVGFARFLGIIGVYLVWYGGVLASLGGSWYYLLSGLATAGDRRSAS